MKKITVLLITLALFAGCSGNKSENEKTAPVVVKTGTVLYQQASQKLINSFGNSLKGELLAAMKDGGATAAIHSCATSAPEIAAQFSNEVITIRRVSDKNRNPQNNANAHEIEIMTNFGTENAPLFFEEMTNTEAGQTYHFYQPIRTGKLCLNCHGSKEIIKPEIYELITETYPGDLAVGYAEGDLRGMFVVEMKLPEAEAIIQNLVADSL